MTAEELMNPRFEVIADYPSNQIEIGAVLNCPNYDNDFTKKHWVEMNEKYPHLFRKLFWWEYRSVEDMPKRLVSHSDSNREVFEIEGWDMERLLGWTDKKKRECCSLLTWNYEYGYFPID